ncbi:hypothetical protein [Defluviicoccus vanus]|uniref:hypothetical protein n=1 Tax=Defluviicoccus vanus TaxID=111831 RepID=UPI001CBA6984|nr:hypothetical protein [Defluviicoccus vanus]
MLSLQRISLSGLMLLAASAAFAAEDLLYETPQEEFETLQQKNQPSARGNFGRIRLDNWGYFQENVNGTDQWQYRARLFVPWVFGNEWIATLRADVPILYTNNKGPANRDGGYSVGVGNIFFEPILDTAPVLPNLTLRTSLRFILKSPDGPPFGVDNQYQIAPGAGFTYRMPDVLRGVIFSPYFRWIRGFNGDEPDTQLTDTVQMIPATTFRLAEGWSFAFYGENPITYNRNTERWFAPLDMLLIYRALENLEFAFGGATKIGDPAGATYNYIINGRVTLFFF